MKEKNKCEKLKKILTKQIFGIRITSEQIFIEQNTRLEREKTIMITNLQTKVNSFGNQKKFLYIKISQITMNFSS